MNWIICLKNTGYEASLEARKLYNLMDDPKAQARGMVRIKDESGEDYLYPSNMFSTITVGQQLERELLAA